jgi:hypothetical protein
MVESMKEHEREIVWSIGGQIVGEIMTRTRVKSGWLYLHQYYGVGPPCESMTFIPDAVPTIKYEETTGCPF